MPLVSVILPAYYSYATLRFSLEALQKQTFQDTEVIVVNSSPEPHTAAIMNAFPEFHFVQSPTRLLPHAARNRGVEEAQGTLLVFSDPDCIADSNWLEYLVKAWQAGHPVVGGSMALRSKRWIVRGIHLCKFHAVLEGQPSVTQWILPTANAAYDREVWDAIGPFDGDLFVADALQCWRAHQQGYPLHFEPRAVVVHRHKETLLMFWRQRVQRGQEFGVMRSTFEDWSRARLLARLAGTPVSILTILSRAARDAARSGWLGTYLQTFPLQVAGHTGWAWGEARGYLSCLQPRRLAPAI